LKHERIRWKQVGVAVYPAVINQVFAEPRVDVKEGLAMLGPPFRVRRFENSIPVEQLYSLIAT
jgi:hypothetical protein